MPDQDHGCHVGERSGASLGRVIVDSALYRKGVRVPVDCSPHDLPRAPRRGDRGRRLRLGRAPRAQRGRARARSPIAFGLHPLAVEDAVNAHQRPKLERYDDRLFLVLKTLWYVDEEDAVETGEINLFVGRATSWSPSGTARAPSCTRRAADLEAREPCSPTARPRSSTPSATRSSTATRTVADELEDDVDEVEESVFSAERTNDSARIYIAQARARRGAPRGAARCASR